MSDLNRIVNLGRGWEEGLAVLVEDVEKHISRIFGIHNITLTVESARVPYGFMADREGVWKFKSEDPLDLLHDRKPTSVHLTVDPKDFGDLLLDLAVWQERIEDRPE